MIMTIHSTYGVLECVPMTLQAIEKSIPESPQELQGTETSPVEEEEITVPIFQD